MYQWCGFKSRRGKNKNLTALKSNSNTVWFNFQTYIYIYIYTHITISEYYTCLWIHFVINDIHEESKLNKMTPFLIHIFDGLFCRDAWQKKIAHLCLPGILYIQHYQSGIIIVTMYLHLHLNHGKIDMFRNAMLIS